jgi:hypothetical protein
MVCSSFCGFVDGCCKTNCYIKIPSHPIPQEKAVPLQYSHGVWGSSALILFLFLFVCDLTYVRRKAEKFISEKSNNKLANMLPWFYWLDGLH